MEKQNIRIKIFAIAKDEAAYIPQWVHHHFYFGFDEIEIWLNNIEDNSIEVCERLSDTYGNFSYKVADDILEECKGKGLHFQRFAYNEVYKRELADKNFTHIFYLDLDEMWTPKDFSTNIKEYLSLYSDKDSISFPWYIDDASYDKNVFTDLFSIKQKIYTNRHVKSLVKITDKVSKVDIHNHLITEGKYILYNGNVFNTSSPESLQGALLPIVDKESESNELDGFFIYHRVFRSQVEYISSLMRGRQHSRHMGRLKDNRWGYKNVGKCFEFIIDNEIVKYNKSYVSFLDRNDIFMSVLEAQRFIINRYYQVKDFVLNNEDKILYERLFDGIHLNEIGKYGAIKYNIDSTLRDDKNIFIIGWIVKNDPTPQDFLDIKFIFCDHNGNEKKLNGEIKFINRPDVVEKVHKSAPVSSGFKFIFPKEYFSSNGLKVSLKSYNHDSETVVFMISESN